MKKSTAKYTLKNVSDVSSIELATKEFTATCEEQSRADKKEAAQEYECEEEDIASSSKMRLETAKKYLQCDPGPSKPVLDPGVTSYALKARSEKPGDSIKMKPMLKCVETSKKQTEAFKGFTSPKKKPKLGEDELVSESSFISTEVSLRTVEGAHDVTNLMPILKKGKASHKIDKFNLEKQPTVPDIIIRQVDSSSSEEDIFVNDYLEYKSEEFAPSVQIPILQGVVVPQVTVNMSKSVTFREPFVTSVDEDNGNIHACKKPASAAEIVPLRGVLVSQTGHKSKSVTKVSRGNVKTMKEKTLEESNYIETSCSCSGDVEVCNVLDEVSSGIKIGNQSAEPHSNTEVKQSAVKLKSKVSYDDEETMTVRIIGDLKEMETSYSYDDTVESCNDIDEVNVGLKKEPEQPTKVIDVNKIDTKISKVKLSHGAMTAQILENFKDIEASCSYHHDLETCQALDEASSGFKIKEHDIDLNETDTKQSEVKLSHISKEIMTEQILDNLKETETSYSFHSEICNAANEVSSGFMIGKESEKHDVVEKESDTKQSEVKLSHISIEIMTEQILDNLKEIETSYSYHSETCNTADEASSGSKVEIKSEDLKSVTEANQIDAKPSNDKDTMTAKILDNFIDIETSYSYDSLNEVSKEDANNKCAQFNTLGVAIDAKQFLKDVGTKHKVAVKTRNISITATDRKIEKAMAQEELRKTISPEEFAAGDYSSKQTEDLRSRADGDRPGSVLSVVRKLVVDPLLKKNGGQDGDQKIGSNVAKSAEIGLWNTLKGLLIPRQDIPRYQDPEFVDQDIQAAGPSTSFDQEWSIQPQTKTSKINEFVVLEAGVSKNKPRHPSTAKSRTDTPERFRSTTYTSRGRTPQAAPPLLKVMKDMKEAVIQTGEPDTAPENKEIKQENTDGNGGNVDGNAAKPEEQSQATGMFSDGVRRADLVLVLRDLEDELEVEVAKVTFLGGLLKAGLQMEAEEGLVNKKLIFIKLHATDNFLSTYAAGFGVQKRFRKSHETFISPCNCCTKFCMFCYEREWINSMRENYKKPFKMSNQDRSYVVYMLLLYNKFGSGPRQFGLQSLIKKRIVVDAYSLHDGPYQLPLGQNKFNGRQILYTHWAGFSNVLWSQPKFLIYEYFGPKVACFFTFYEVCNRFLLAMGLWGLFCMLMYLTLDYSKPVREFVCTAFKVFNVSKLPVMSYKKDFKWMKQWQDVTLQCAECEGHENITICPYTWIHNYCLDMVILKHFDNPYLVLYSFGCAIMGAIFLVYWRRLESFFVWVTEEDNEACSGHLFVRPNYKDSPEWSPRNIPKIIGDQALKFVRLLFFDTLLPLLIIFVPMIIVFIAFVWGYEGTRSLSSGDADLWKPKEKYRNLRVTVALIDKYMEYAVYMAVAFIVCVVLYGLEKLFHLIAYYVESVGENHRTFAIYEEQLIRSLSWTSFHCMMPVVLYFGFLKGSFYHTPLQFFDVIFRVEMPWEVLTYNMTEIFPKYAKLLRIAASLNCVVFSCFRQAVIVFLVIFFVRIVIIDLINFVLRRVKLFVFNLWKYFRYKVMSTCEREYMLPNMTHRELMLHYNRLVMQMALVILFSPLFPPAPLILFLLNSWDMRDRADMLVVHTRRPLLERTRGIGAWRQQVKLLFLALPLFHGILIARTEVFDALLYMKLSNAMTKHVNLTRFLFYQSYLVGTLGRLHPRFKALNKQRTEIEYYKNMPGNDLNVKFVADMTPNGYWPTPVATCHTYGHLSAYIGGREGKKWPEYANLISERPSSTCALPEHYQWMYYKVAYVTLLMVLVWSLWLILKRCFGKYSAGVQRMRARERQLHRLHLPLVHKYTYTLSTVTTLTPAPPSTPAPTTTPALTSTPAPTTTHKPTTTPALTLTPAPTSTPAPTTTPALTSTLALPSDPAPTTTSKPTTTPSLTSTPALTATHKPTTTPALTSTPAPTTTPEPTISPTLTSTPAPTTIPKSTTTPALTSTPAPTTIPESTTAPALTSTPAPTTTPESTTTPALTSTPAPTTIPESTTTPALTSTPAPTTTPESTTTPALTSTPAPTTTPESTTTPALTSTPAPTTTPESTTTPALTSTPAPTTTPESTTTPALTSTPAPTTTPVLTPTPTPTTTPKPTITPSKTSLASAAALTSNN